MELGAQRHGLDLPGEVLSAEARIRPFVRETPLEASPRLGRRAHCEVYLKLENLQHTGSFKVRGAFNRLLKMAAEERRAGVVTASTGNHGAAMAFAMARLGVEGRILVPEGASRSKVAAIQRLGGEVRFHGDDGAVAERYARDLARRRGMTYVSPYNDPAVIGGQGTVGVEIARQIEPPDLLFVAVGGGGLVAGVAGYLKSRFAGVRLIGCQPRASAVMSRSVAAGEILDLASSPTLSDGTAGGVEEGSITFDPCRDLVDEWMLISEAEIESAMRGFIRERRMAIEGAAALVVAAFERSRQRWAGKRVVLLICGGNVDRATLDRVMAGRHRDGR